MLGWTAANRKVHGVSRSFDILNKQAVFDYAIAIQYFSERVVRINETGFEEAAFIQSADRKEKDNHERYGNAAAAWTGIHRVLLAASQGTL